MSLDLESRSALPDALRALVEEVPRDMWDNPSPFQGLVRFWMEKHLSFRRLIDAMDADVKIVLDGGDQAHYRRRLARLGGMFVNELHGHHHIEDAHYFPVLQAVDPVFARGLEILDADHDALAERLQSFTDKANAILSRPLEGAAFTDAAGALQTHLATSGPMLWRHFEDEEDLVVPVLLKHEPDALRM